MVDFQAGAWKPGGLVEALASGIGSSVIAPFLNRKAGAWKPAENLEIRANRKRLIPVRIAATSGHWIEILNFCQK